MIDRFNWCVCGALVVTLQLCLLASPVMAFAESPSATGESRTGVAVAEDLSEPVVPLPSVPVNGQLPEARSVPEAQTVSPTDKGGVAPAEQSLAALTGKTEIPVLVDIDRRFVDSLAVIQLSADDTASQIDEADLSKAVRAGRSFNRESLAALARREQAKAQTEQALAFLRPSATLRVASGHERSEPSVKIDDATGEPVPSDNHTRTDVALTLRQPLFNLPSFFDWRRRQVVERARDENYRVSEGDAFIATVEAYLSLVSSRLQTDMTRDFEAQLAELLSYIEKRASAGAASVSDMARVRARIQATLSSRLEQENANAAARIEFVRLTNLVPQKVRLPVLEDVGAALLPESFELAVATAMENNPEIAALNAEVRTAKIDLSAAKSRFLPRLDAEYTDSYSLGAGGETSSSGQRDRRTMLVLNWDMFSGGSDYQYHLERTARHKELLYRFDDQRRRVVQALSINYSALATTGERIHSGYRELKSIATAAEAMSKRMISGNQSLLDLLDVYDRLYQVRSRLVSLHVLEMNAVAQLIRATRGTPWSVLEDNNTNQTMSTKGG